MNLDLNKPVFDTETTPDDVPGVNPQANAEKGAAAGGAAGAVAGAIAGATLGPAGAAIGAVIGGIAGAAVTGVVVAATDTAGEEGHSDYIQRQADLATNEEESITGQSVPLTDATEPLGNDLIAPEDNLGMPRDYVEDDLGRQPMNAATTPEEADMIADHEGHWNQVPAPDLTDDDITQMHDWRMKTPSPEPGSEGWVNEKVSDS
jgi:hypothetical protein